MVLVERYLKVKLKNLDLTLNCKNCIIYTLTAIERQNMKLVEFTYTKSDGSTTKRAVIELVTPTKYVEGIDVTQLSESDFASFTQAISQLKTAQHNETMSLLDTYDLNHNYRKFIPEQMSDVTSDYV